MIFITNEYKIVDICKSSVRFRYEPFGGMKKWYAA